MNLREIRKSQNLSVPELSRLSGVSVRTMLINKHYISFMRPVISNFRYL